MIKYFLSFLLLILFFSCEQKQKKIILKKQSKYFPSIVKKQGAIAPVQNQFLSKLDSWKEYHNLSDFILRFEKTSPNEALSNALELKDLIKSLKDSVPKTLQNNALKARINVLHNEALRLADMSYITSIKTENVNNQIKKILETYNALNIKINTIFLQKKFEESIDLKNLYIGIDTTKVDSSSIIALKTKTPKKLKNFNKIKKQRKNINKLIKKSNRKITRE